MNKPYVEFGTVFDLPDDLIAGISDFTLELHQEARIAKRVGLAGPNDIFDFVMLAELWVMMLPWVREALSGATVYVGGYLTSMVLKSRAERKIDRRVDDLTAAIDHSFETQEALLGGRMDKILQLLNQTRTPWGNELQIRLGLKGGLDDADRAVIFSAIIPEFSEKVTDPANLPPKIIQREDVAQAILTCALLGPTIESYMERYRIKHGSETRFTGTFAVLDNSHFSADIFVENGKSPLPQGRLAIRLELGEEIKIIEIPETL